MTLYNFHDVMLVMWILPIMPVYSNVQPHGVVVLVVWLLTQVCAVGFMKKHKLQSGAKGLPIEPDQPNWGI